MSDENAVPPTGGVKARWWQQTEEKVPYQSSFITPDKEVAVAVTPVALVVLDIGEELEAEASTAVASGASTGERVVVPVNQALNLAKLRRRLLLVAILTLPIGFALGIFLAILFGNLWPLAFGLVFPLEIAILNGIMRRKYLCTAQSGDYADRRRDGDSLFQPRYCVTPLDEIAEIKSYRSGYKFIGICLRDPRAFSAAHPAEKRVRSV